MTAVIEDDDLFVEAWSKFNELVHSDEDAADLIFHSLLQENEIECGCSSPKILREPGARCFYCASCKREVWFTAGTLLSGVSRLRAWMAVIWFKEWGVTVSSLRISKLLDIAQSTALNINKKVAIALASQMDDSAMIIDPKTFSAAIFKRSRHTPADEHPLSELLENNSRATDSSDADEVESRQAKNKRVFSLADCQQQFGISMAIASAIAFIRKYFHGVSHKYLQLYVAAFWCHVDRATWKKGSVLMACLKHPPVSYIKLLNYESPELKMMLV